MDRILGWRYWSLLSNSFFFVASIFWLASPISCLYELWAPCAWIGLFATSFFLLNALVCLLMWFATHRANEDQIFGGSVFRRHAYERFDYVLWGAVLFLLGCLVDYVTGYWSSWYNDGNGDGGIYSSWLYLAGSILWQAYSVLEIVRCLLEKRNRRLLHAKHQFSLSTPRAMAWDLLGAILFFVAEAFYLIDALLIIGGRISTNASVYMQITGATLFILNSLALYAANIRSLRLGSDLQRLTSESPDLGTLETAPIL